MSALLDGKTLVLSSGRRLSEYDQMIGINPDMRVGGGFDDLVTEKIPPPWRAEDAPDERPFCFSAEERRELADYMIGLWQEFAK